MQTFDRHDYVNISYTPSIGEHSHMPCSICGTIVAIRLPSQKGVLPFEAREPVITGVLCDDCKKECMMKDKIKIYTKEVNPLFDRRGYAIKKIKLGGEENDYQNETIADYAVSVYSNGDIYIQSKAYPEGYVNIDGDVLGNLIDILQIALSKRRDRLNREKRVP